MGGARGPNHALQPNRPSRSGCNRTPSWAGSLSLGRYSLSSSGCYQLSMVLLIENDYERNRKGITQCPQF